MGTGSNAVGFLAAPSVADGQVGRGRRYPTPAARSARARESPRADKQNGKVNSIGGSLPRQGLVGRGCRCSGAFRSERQRTVRNGG
jgi:hypothetical protein